MVVGCQGLCRSRLLLAQPRAQGESAPFSPTLETYFSLYSRIWIVGMSQERKRDNAFSMCSEPSLANLEKAVSEPSLRALLWPESKTERIRF